MWQGSPSPLVDLAMYLVHTHARLGCTSMGRLGFAVGCAASATRGCFGQLAEQCSVATQETTRNLGFVFDDHFISPRDSVTSCRTPSHCT